MIETLWQDIRFGLRQLRKNPGFTAVAVLTLALSIGANTAIFTWMKAVVLDYLPGVKDPGQLVILIEMNRDRTGCCGSTSYLNYKDYNERNQVFDGILGWELITVNLQSDGPAERVLGTVVTGNYFDVLGARAALGRTFLPEEDQAPGTHPVAVISHKLWQRNFNADPSAAGEKVSINNYPYTVVGVMPEGFGGSVPGFAFDIFIPTMMQRRVWPARGGDMVTARQNNWLDLQARLKPGVTIEQAQAEIDRVALQIEQDYPGFNTDRSLRVFSPLRSPLGVQGRLVPVVTILMVIVGLVLLIACGNVANLLLARASARRREIGIRLAMGATRSRLIFQLLTESILLSLLAGTAGLLLAVWAVQGMVGLMPPIDVPIRFNLGLDKYVLGFTLFASLLTGMIFGLIPAFRTSNVNPVSALKDSVGGGSRMKSRLQSALVIAQVAFSVITLITAGLFLRSMQTAQNFDAGFNPDHALMVSMNVFPNGYTQDEGRLFYEQLLTRIENIPGVRSATLARRPPMTQRGARGTSFSEVEGYQPAPDERLGSIYDNVGPNYFRTMEIPLRSGRDFAPQDRAGSPPVTIVNETFARKFWPGQNPLGKRIRRGNTWIEVVGVARDVKYRSFNEESRLYMYAPHQQVYEPDMTLIIRTTVEPSSLASAVRHEVASLDPTIALFGLMTMRNHVNLALLPQRAAGSGSGVIGLLALGLAAVGLYGVVAYSVSRRTHEIGIRMALGARPHDILKLVIAQGLMLTLIGAVLGLAAAFAVTRLLTFLLYGISPTDPLTFAGVPLLLAAVALVACYIPARRATKVDPMVALRYE